MLAAPLSSVSTTTSWSRRQYSELSSVEGGCIIPGERMHSPDLLQGSLAEENDGDDLLGDSSTRNSSKVSSSSSSSSSVEDSEIIFEFPIHRMFPEMFPYETKGGSINVGVVSSLDSVNHDDDDDDDASLSTSSFLLKMAASNQSGQISLTNYYGGGACLSTIDGRGLNNNKKKPGWCIYCGKTKTHKRKFFGLVLVPLTNNKSYHGYCIQCCPLVIPIGVLLQQPQQKQWQQKRYFPQQQQKQHLLASSAWPRDNNYEATARKPLAERLLNDEKINTTIFCKKTANNIPVITTKDNYQKPTNKNNKTMMKNKLGKETPPAPAGPNHRHQKTSPSPSSSCLPVANAVLDSDEDFQVAEPVPWNDVIPTNIKKGYCTTCGIVKTHWKLPFCTKEFPLTNRKVRRGYCRQCCKK